jgi:hypothetical protein
VLFDSFGFIIASLILGIIAVTDQGTDPNIHELL